MMPTPLALTFPTTPYSASLEFSTFTVLSTLTPMALSSSSSTTRTKASSVILIATCSRWSKRSTPGRGSTGLTLASTTTDPASSCWRGEAGSSASCRPLTTPGVAWEAALRRTPNSSPNCTTTLEGARMLPQSTLITSRLVSVSTISSRSSTTPAKSSTPVPALSIRTSKLCLTSSRTLVFPVLFPWPRRSSRWPRTAGGAQWSNSNPVALTTGAAAASGESVSPHSSASPFRSSCWSWIRHPPTTSGASSRTCLRGLTLSIPGRSFASLGTQA
mmetsp:Transcript_2249/g.4607  ORF Transcript_2249/g.4607 Transcript_2249/m.4607 type:complete len:274 (+) Transcript_2249:1288-2109(+)